MRRENWKKDRGKVEVLGKGSFATGYGKEEEVKGRKVTKGKLKKEKV